MPRLIMKTWPMRYYTFYGTRTRRVLKNTASLTTTGSGMDWMVTW